MNNPILTESNYHSPEANMFYMSATQYRRFCECECLALAELRGEHQFEPSAALLIGSYVDAHFSGTLDQFKERNPVIFRRDGSLKSEYEHANYIIQRIERDDHMMAALSGEKQVILTGQIEGVPVKIKIDSMLPDRTVDQKIIRDLEDIYVPGEGRKPFWIAWGYHYQAAIYQEIRAQNEGGKKKPFGLAVATKEKPEPDIALFELPQPELDLALEEIRYNIVHFDSLKKDLYDPEPCGICPVCRREKKLNGWVLL